MQRRNPGGTTDCTRDKAALRLLPARCQNVDVAASPLGEAAWKRTIRPAGIGDVLGTGRYVRTNGNARRAGTYQDCTIRWPSPWGCASIAIDQDGWEGWSDQRVVGVIVGVLLGYCRICPDI